MIPGKLKYILLINLLFSEIIKYLIKKGKLKKEKDKIKKFIFLNIFKIINL